MHHFTLKSQVTTRANDNLQRRRRFCEVLHLTLGGSPDRWVAVEPEQSAHEDCTTLVPVHLRSPSSWPQFANTGSVCYPRTFRISRTSRGSATTSVTTPLEQLEGSPKLNISIFINEYNPPKHWRLRSRFYNGLLYHRLEIHPASNSPRLSIAYVVRMRRCDAYHTYPSQ